AATAAVACGAPFTKIRALLPFGAPVETNTVDSNVLPQASPSVSSAGPSVIRDPAGFGVTKLIAKHSSLVTVTEMGADSTEPERDARMTWSPGESVTSSN